MPVYALDGLAPRLAVDRPGWAVIVRLAFLRSPIDVGENAETEVRVFVEDLALWPVVTEVSGDEGLVLQDILDEGTHPRSTPGTRIRREDAMTFGREPLERVPQ